MIHLIELLASIHGYYTGLNVLRLHNYQCVECLIVES